MVKEEEKRKLGKGKKEKNMILTNSKRKSKRKENFANAWL